MAEGSGRMSRNREVRERVVEKVQANILETGKLTQQMLKSSRSRDILAQTTKHFVNQEASIANSAEKVKNVSGVVTAMKPQFNEINNSLHMLATINHQLDQVWK